MANKEQEQQKTTQDKLNNAPKTRCSVCKRSTSPRMECTCGGGAAGDADQKENAATASSPKEPASGAAIVANPLVATTITKDWSLVVQQQQDKTFAVDSILDLFAKQLIVMTDNKELGILTLKCLNPELLSSEQKQEFKKFVSAIDTEFNKFLSKHALSKNSNSANMEKDRQGSILSLTISIANPKLYDLFIQELLENKNLLAILSRAENLTAVAATPVVATLSDDLPAAKTAHLPKDSSSKNASSQEAPRSSFHPSPLSTKLKPKGWKE